MKLTNDDRQNVGTKWTIDEDNKLVQEIVDKKSYEEIALEHKRTITGIKSRVVSHIIYPKYKDNIDVKKLSIEYNIDEYLIMRYINKSKPDKKKGIIEYLEEINNKIEILLNK